MQMASLQRGFRENQQGLVQSQQLEPPNTLGLPGGSKLNFELSRLSMFQDANAQLFKAAKGNC